MRSSLTKLSKLIRLLTRPDYRRGLPFGVAAAVEHADLIALLRLGTVIDVGANVGQFSLLVNTLHPQVVIHAFEPLEEAASVFDRLFVGRQHVTLHRCAAGAEDCETEIHVSGRADSSSLLPISELQDRAFSGTAAIANRKIPVRRVDDILDGLSLPGPLLIKLDVQGYEMEALRGMPRILAKADYVYAELSFAPLYEGQPLAHDVIAWLAAHSFDLASINTLARLATGVAVQADALFCTRAAANPVLASLKE
jgi:FkbM family methyltransferase